jgi:hypothetical protein
MIAYGLVRLQRPADLRMELAQTENPDVTGDRLRSWNDSEWRGQARRAAAN